MLFITLKQIKKQCRLDADDNSEDPYLELIGLAAEQAVENHLNRTLYADKVPEGESEGLVVTSDITMAMLLMVGQFYENREATSEFTMKKVPLAYSYLLERYRIIPV